MYSCETTERMQAGIVVVRAMQIFGLLFEKGTPNEFICFLQAIGKNSVEAEKREITRNG